MEAAQYQQRVLVTTRVQPILDPHLLPDRFDPNIALEPASLAEFEHASRLNAAAFKGFLSDSSFIDRQFHLAEGDLAKDGAYQSWILTSSTLPTAADGSRPILAACKTIRKTGYVAKGGSLEKITAHGIGSVFCRSEYRGRGYATRMFEELGKRLETFQQPEGDKGIFSALYSGIGPDFYGRLGWKAFPSTHISLDPIDNAGEYHQRKAEIVPLPQLEDLKTKDLIDLPIVQNLEARLVQMSSASPSKAFVTFRPDTAQIEWQFLREEFLVAYLGREEPQIKGAIDRETGVALIWSRTYAEDPLLWTLHVLYTHVPVAMVGTEAVQRSLSALLLRAQHEAKLWDMQHGVEIWDPQEDAVRAAQAISRGQNIQVINRDYDYICSLKWNSTADDEVIWIANERFAYL